MDFRKILFLLLIGLYTGSCSGDSTAPTATTEAETTEATTTTPATTTTDAATTTTIEATTATAAAAATATTTEVSTTAATTAAAATTTEAVTTAAAATTTEAPTTAAVATSAAATTAATTATAAATATTAATAAATTAAATTTEEASATTAAPATVTTEVSAPTSTAAATTAVATAATTAAAPTTATAEATTAATAATAAATTVAATTTAATTTEEASATTAAAATVMTEVSAPTSTAAAATTAATTATATAAATTTAAAAETTAAAATAATTEQSSVGSSNGVSTNGETTTLVTGVTTSLSESTTGNESTNAASTTTSEPSTTKAPIVTSKTTQKTTEAAKPEQPTKQPNTDNAVAVFEFTLTSNGDFDTCKECWNELIKKLKQILGESGIRGFYDVVGSASRGSIKTKIQIKLRLSEMGNITIPKAAEEISKLLTKEESNITASLPTEMGSFTDFKNVVEAITDKYKESTQCTANGICADNYKCMVGSDGYTAENCLFMCAKLCANDGVCFVDEAEGVAQCKCAGDTLYQYYGDTCQHRGAKKELILILCLSIGGGLLVIFLLVIVFMSRRMISRQQEHKLLSMDRVSSMTEEELAMRQMTYTSPVNKYDEKLGKFQPLQDQSYDNNGYVSEEFRPKSDRSSGAYEYLPDNTIIYRGMPKTGNDPAQNILENIDTSADYSIRRPQVTPMPDKINSRYVYQDLEMKTSI